MAKCPKCEKNVGRVVLQDVTIGGLGMNEFAGVSYSCPHCQTILSVAIDPVALKSDTVNEVLRGVKKML